MKVYSGDDSPFSPFLTISQNVVRADSIFLLLFCVQRKKKKTPGA